MSTPVWRQAFDHVERAVVPKLDEIVRSDAFAEVAASAFNLARLMSKRAERQSRQVLHFFNLPTATDLHRIGAQLAAVDRRLRESGDGTARRARAR